MKKHCSLGAKETHRQNSSTKLSLAATFFKLLL